MLSQARADAQPRRTGSTRRARLFFAIALVLVSALGALSIASVLRVRDDAALVAHTYRVESELNALLAQITDAESGQRGFLLTGDSTQLASYHAAARSLSGTLVELRDLTADNPVQQARLDVLVPTVADRLALLQRRLQLPIAVASAADSASRALIVAGADNMRSIERVVSTMHAGEAQLLARRSGASLVSERLAVVVLLAGSIVTIALIVAGSGLLRRELRERERAEAELRDSETRFRRLADASPDAIVLSSHGRIQDVNGAFVRLFGYAELELEGQPVQRLVPTVVHEEVSRRVELDVEGEYETTGLRKDGTSFPLSVASRVFTYAGQPVRVSLLRDLSERQEIDRMKREFVSTVSHELRTPLTSIRGSLGLVESGVTGALPPRALELVRIARSNTERLVRLINDILDVEKLEAGKLELRLATVDPRELAEATLEGVSGMAQQAGVAMHLEVEDSRHVRGDRDRLVQVLTNLLSNAIKFAPGGGVVTTRIARAGDGQLRIAVEDTGPGIAAEHLPRLFQKFAQIDSSDRRSQGGTGLGLVICKAIVAEHGGIMGVHSEPHVRTTFWFDLPALQQRHAPLVHPVGEGPRVLLVEDDGDVAEVVAGMLAPTGYGLTRARSIAEATTLLEQERFAAVLLDIGLPDGDGLDFIERLRQEQPMLDLPVVVVSGREPDGTFQHPQLVDWILKPFEGERVQHALHRALRRPGPARAIVVDDDAGTRRVVAARLRALAFEVFEASDGEDALAQCRVHMPDLVILDVSMPNMDGFEFVALCRESGLPSPPLIVYSGRELNATERRSLTLGVTRHLTKARTSEEQFVASVREMLGDILDAA